MNTIRAVSAPERPLAAPLRLDPVTSVSMAYLRAFAQQNVTQPGKVRISRKAMHMLRMHWAYVQCRRLAEWSES